MSTTDEKCLTLLGAANQYMNNWRITGMANYKKGDKQKITKVLDSCLEKNYISGGYVERPEFDTKIRIDLTVDEEQWEFINLLVEMEVSCGRLED